MGGRGSSGGAPGSAEPKGRRMSLASFLSKQDIERANAASVADIGDIIKRTFERNANEINSLYLSDSEKKDAVKEMASLATTALKTAAGAVNPYASGVARLTTAQKTGSAADRAAKDRGEAEKWIAICVNFAISQMQTKKQKRKKHLQILLLQRKNRVRLKLQ